MRERFKLIAAGFFLLLPWIFFDIDMGDQAWSSVSSWLMAFHPQAVRGALPVWFEVSPVWFSLFLGSIWWKIIGPWAPILVLRLGWILWNLGMLVTIDFFLRQFFPQRKTKWAALAGLMAVASTADLFVISYNLVAPALGALLVCFLALGLLRGRLWIFLGGALAMLTIQARIPTAVFILPFLALILLLDFYFLRNGRRLAANAAWIVGGLALGAGISWLSLVSMGQDSLYFQAVGNFFAGVDGGTNVRYSKLQLLERTLGHYKKISVGALMFLLFVAFVSCKEKWKNVALAICGCLIAFFASTKYGLVLACVIGGSLVVLGWRATRLGRAELMQRLPLYLGAGMVVVAFTFGTNLEGLQNFKYGLWLLVPLAVMESEAVSISFLRPLAFRNLILVSVAVLFGVTRLLWPTYPYLERTIFSMNARFGSPALAGMFSYPDKQQPLDEVISELSRRGLQPGQDFLCYSPEPPYYPIASLYSITRTVPLLNDPSIIEYPVSRWPKNKIRLEEMAKSSELPRIVVRQRQPFPWFKVDSFRLPLTLLRETPPKKNFSGTGFDWSGEETSPIGKELDEILKNAGYRAAWMNDFFVILEKP